ncbi:hypothetical protein D3C77_460080 [compost metagenome]
MPFGVAQGIQHVYRNTMADTTGNAAGFISPTIDNELTILAGVQSISGIGFFAIDIAQTRDRWITRSAEVSE